MRQKDFDGFNLLRKLVSDSSETVLVLLSLWSHPIFDPKHLKLKLTSTFRAEKRLEKRIRERQRDAFETSLMLYYLTVKVKDEEIKWTQ